MAKPRTTKIPRIVQLPSGAYYCRIRTNGEDISITDADYAIVEAKAYAYKVGLLEEKKKPRDLTVGEAVDEYIKYRENILAPSTIRGYKIIRKSRFPELMKIPLSKINLSLLQRHINDEASHYSAKTIKNSFALIRSALDNENIDIKWDKLLFPQIRKNEVYTPSPDELKKLLSAADDVYLILIILLPAWLSLRRSEVLGLFKSDFDTVNHCVHIQRGLIIEGNKERKFTPTKTFKSQRTILTDPYISSLVETLPDGQIFTRDRNVYARMLRKLCEKAGVKRVTMLGLRHFNASAMAMVGIDAKYAMDRGGWSSEHTMRNVYQEIMDDGTIAAANRINTFFRQLI